MDDDALLQLAEQVGRLLLKNNAILTLAESCTGGLVSSLITEIAGSSKWFDSGLITYSNAAKQQLLGVSEDSLSQFGAVSEQVAAEMAMGALKHGRATISASITGIAGPDGGSDKKPVGTVCFSWCGLNISTSTCTHYLQGSRHEIRMQSASIALKGVIRLLS